MDPITNVPTSEAVLNQLIEHSQEKKASTGWYIILALAFPPFTTVLAIILAARKNVLHLVMPNTVIIFSVLTLLTGLSNLINVGSQSQYAQYATVEPPLSLSILAKILTFLCVAVGAAGIFAGLKFRAQANREFTLERNITISLIGLFLLECFLVGWLSIVLVQSYFNSVAPIIKRSYQGI